MSTAMPFPPATIALAHAVVQFAAPQTRDPARDELFIGAVDAEFPNVITRQYLPSETPAVAPHLVLASTSSQLAVSAVQADFEVRFYGEEYVSDFGRAFEYVERKLMSLLQGLEAANIRPMTIGLITNLRFSFRAVDESPAIHVLTTHLRSEVDPDDVQDALARVALRVRDTYFVTLTVANYEMRTIERPLMPGGVVQIRSWEGEVGDQGIELSIDVNNNLQALATGEAPSVTGETVGAVVALGRAVATSGGPVFVETGAIPVGDLATEATG
jgi:hypothetical protein